MNDLRPTGALRHLPNTITIARILAGLAGAWLLLEAAGAQSERGAVAYGAASGLLFVISALSDFLDGWLARALGAVSPLGALLDPIADKVLVGAYFIAFALIIELHAWLTPAVAIIIARDVLVTGMRLSRLRLEAVPLAVSDDAKFKTALQMILIALPFLAVALFYNAGLSQEAWDNLILFWIGGVWLAAALSAWTAVPYLRKAFGCQ